MIASLASFLTDTLDGVERDAPIRRPPEMPARWPGAMPAPALASVRQARASIAANKSMADDVRREVLDELDHTIADMEKDAG